MKSLKSESMVIFFPCKSIEETVDFYSSTLNFSIYKDLGKSVWVDSGYGYIGFVEYDPPRDRASGACISFNLESVEAVDRMYELLISKGLKIKSAPEKHTKFPVYSFFFEDNNGYLLEFQKPLD